MRSYHPWIAFDLSAWQTRIRFCTEDGPLSSSSSGSGSSSGSSTHCTVSKKKQRTHGNGVGIGPYLGLLRLTEMTGCRH